MRLFFFFILINFISCKGGKTTTDASGMDKGNTSRKDDGVAVIQITESHSYCGGARPTEEMYKEITTPRIAAGKKVFIKPNKNGNSDTTVIFSGITDANGHVVVCLPEGDYILVDNKKNDRTYYNELLTNYSKPTMYRSAIDTACLNKWFKTPDLTFKIEKNKTLSYELNYHIPCSWASVPCSKYDGPLPP